MIKHVSESASAQLCEFSSGRFCVLCLEYMGMCLCAPGCFKISALLSSGTLIGKPLRLPFGDDGGGGDGGGGVFYKFRVFALELRACCKQGAV